MPHELAWTDMTLQQGNCRGFRSRNGQGMALPQHA
jgi:hypothetical protein